MDLGTINGFDLLMLVVGAGLACVVTLPEIRRLHRRVHDLRVRLAQSLRHEVEAWNEVAVAREREDKIYALLRDVEGVIHEEGW